MYLHDKSATHSLQLSSWKRSGVKCYEKKKKYLCAQSSHQKQATQ